MTDKNPAAEAAGPSNASGDGAPADALPWNPQPTVASPARAKDKLDDGEAPAIVGAADAALYMFVAAIVPALMTIVFNLVAIAIAVRRRPQIAPVSDRVSWPERWIATRCAMRSPASTSSPSGVR